MPPTATRNKAAIERKSIGSSIYPGIDLQWKVVDEEQGIIKGYLAVFNNIDSQKDRVRPGSFRKTIADGLERKSNLGKKFLWPLLWMHNPEKPIGGFVDAVEDKIGLLVTAQLDITSNEQGIPRNPLAMSVFSGFKEGYIDELSIGYKALQKSYDNEGVRDLTEIQLFEGSAVTMMFASNPLAQVTQVKAIYNQQDEEIGYVDEDAEGNERYVLFEETKAVVGSTSLPIGPRDEAWDGSKAKGQIFNYAKKDDGTFDVSKLKKCFMVQDGDPQQKGSWSYPFCYIKSGSPMICVGAVKAIVAAIGGARGANAPDGLKSKCKTLYNRINAKYPNDPPLTIPDKSTDEDLEEKDFNSRYADAMARDVLEDWYDLSCSLKYALIDAFTQGDEPLKDAQIALDQFGPALIAWVQRGVDADLSEYLAAQMQSSGTSSYGYSSYMSRPDMPDFKYYIDQLQQERKKGAKVSKSTSDQIAAHVDTLDNLAEQHKSMIKSHRLAMKTINSVADDLSAVIGRVAYGENADVAEEDNAARTGKSNREPRADKAALTQQEQPDEQPTANHDLAQLQAWLEAKVSSKG